MRDFTDNEEDTLLEILQEWVPGKAEQFAKACCLENETEAQSVVIEEGRGIDAAKLIAYLQSSKQKDAGPMDALELENNISWRPFDHEIVDLVRRGQRYYAVLSLVLQDRCNYNQAEKLVRHWETRTHPGNKMLVSITQQAAQELLPQGFEAIVRYRDLIWKTHIQRENVFHPSGKFVALSQLDQIWQIQPSA